MLSIHQFPCLSDNYGVLVHDPASGKTAAIDVPEAAAVEQALKENGWELSHVLITHHHHDHIGGLAAVRSAHHPHVIGPRADNSRIPGLDFEVGEGDTFDFAGHPVRVFETPGHTSGHVSYWFPDDKVVFTGDTLFALGCGRIFEGTARQMWDSLSKLAALPADTQVYCGHEYTLSNARFAATVDPANPDLKTRVAAIEALRSAGKPTLPTTIGEELATNPFLRAGDKAIRAHLGLSDAADWEVFAEIRRRKDAA